MGTPIFFLLLLRNDLLVFVLILRLVLLHELHLLLLLGHCDLHVDVRLVSLAA